MAQPLPKLFINPKLICCWSFLPDTLMAMQDQFVMLWLIVFYVPIAVAYMTIEKTGTCTDNNIFNLTVNLESLGNRNHKIRINVNVTMPLGRNVNAKTQLFLSIRNKWVEVLSFSDNDFCHYISHTNAKVLHDLQRKSGTRVGCPVQPGYYTLDEYEINNGNLSFDIIPKGKVRLLLQAFISATKTQIVCLEIIATNK